MTLYNNYPVPLSFILLFAGIVLVYLRLAGIIERPTILGFFLIGQGVYIYYKLNKKNRNIKISDKVAEAMASKIVMEAKWHRKEKEKFNKTTVFDEHQEEE